MADTINIEDYQIEQPSKPIMDNEIKVSEEQETSVEEVSKELGSVTLQYKTPKGAICIIGSNSIMVQVDVEFECQVKPSDCVLLLEEFETARHAAYIMTREGHADDVIMFQLDGKSQVITVRIEQCTIAAAQANFEKVTSKLLDFGAANIYLPPVLQGPVSPFVRFRCLLFYQDKRHYVEAKSEAIMLKPPLPPPLLVGIQPTEILFSRGPSQVTVNLDRELFVGSDSVFGARLELTEQEISINAEIHGSSDPGTLNLSFNVGARSLWDRSVRVQGKIRLLGTSDGVDWCVEAGVSLLPMPPNKLERRQREMTVHNMEMDEVDWSALC